VPPIDLERTVRLLAAGDADGAQARVKGQALEQAIRYVFEQIPGVSCSMQDERGAFESEEVDLFFANFGHEDGLVRFEPELLVEAKNWSRKVDASNICWFATKLRRRNRHIGVLVAARGITGNQARRTAARFEIMLALNEGQEVLVLTREELEAVPTGERLAALLQNKRDHLVARQDIYIADATELRQGQGVFHHGFGVFAAMLSGERTQRIEEAMARRVELPADNVARADVLRQALQEVQRLIEERRRDPDLDPQWKDVREGLLQAAALAVAWLDDLGFSQAETIRTNAALRGMDRLRVSVSSAMWKTLSDYYTSQLAFDDPERTREGMLFELVGMLIEEIWAIDEYVPEPEVAYE
jgi:hypothetical protein